MLAGGSQVREQGRPRGDLVEPLQRQVDTRAPGERDQVDDRVGRAAQGGEHDDGVVERLGGQDVRGPQSAPGKLDSPRARELGHGVAPGVRRRHGRGPRQCHAERLHESGHGRGRSELVAVAHRRVGGSLQFGELGLRHAAGAYVLGVAPEVASHRELPAAEARRLGRPARHHDHRDVDADCAHELRRHGLVAAREQNDGVERMRADVLLDIHRHEVAIEHRRGLHEVLAERCRPELQRQSARLLHAPPHGRREPAEVEVAVDELRPRVADADDRATADRGAGEALGAQGGAMDEAAHAGRVEPAGASQRGRVTGRFWGTRHLWWLLVRRSLTSMAGEIVKRTQTDRTALDLTQRLGARHDVDLVAARLDIGRIAPQQFVGETGMTIHLAPALRNVAQELRPVLLYEPCSPCATSS